MAFQILEAPSKVFVARALKNPGRRGDRGADCVQ
jgi:hypothetical protein